MTGEIKRTKTQLNININHSSLSKKPLVESHVLDVLREWRDDALKQHLYPTAIFYARKCYSITDSIQDIYALANAHFISKEYGRAEHLLNSDVINASFECRLLSAQCAAESKKWAQVLEILPTDLNVVPAKDTLNIINIESSLHYLRGIAYCNTNKSDLGKQSLIEAIKKDFKCFQAFEWLVENHMLSKEEEDILIKYVCLNGGHEYLPMIKLFFHNKSNHTDLPIFDKERLSAQYGLENDMDLKLSHAVSFFNHAKYSLCLEVTLKIIAVDPFGHLPLLYHIASLFELEKKNDLFVIAHKLVDGIPDASISWYAVGAFYLLSGKNHEARRYFSKSSTMSPLIGAFWVGFAHTFALESEHDQAISAYSAASRLLKGNHVTFMFIGMQNLEVGNFNIAKEYLLLAYDICSTDTLLNQELGVLYFNLGEYEQSLVYFKHALGTLSKENTSSLTAAVHGNMGHSYRKMRDFDNSKKSFLKSLSILPEQSWVLASIGIIHQIEFDYDKAILFYHEALSFEPENSVYIEMLDTVLSEISDKNPIEIMPEISCSFSSPAPNMYQKYFEESKSIKDNMTTNTKIHASGGAVTRSQSKSNPYSKNPFILSGSNSTIDALPRNNLFAATTTPTKNSRVSDKFNSVASNGSSFMLSPMGGTGNLFFCGSKKDPIIEDRESESDLDILDDVDMDIDEL